MGDNFANGASCGGLYYGKIQDDTYHAGTKLKHEILGRLKEQITLVEVNDVDG
nr:hypothetical protein [Carboxylicivirga mesophila]